MRSKKTDLAIVNRSFWPQSQVIGEGLLQFAERVAEEQTVCVIAQTKVDLQGELRKKGRGQGVQIRACKSYTTSASGVIKRISEAVFFMFWTFYSLIKARPSNVYVATDPPVVVPFIVALYCRLFNANFVYHLQDIHPEATNIALPLSQPLYWLLQRVDNYTLRHATAIITLSEDMRSYILQRSETRKPIYLMDNPSLEVVPVSMESRTKDVIFCGNAGRLQRIPLLLAAISKYLEVGGKMCFTFVGGGVHVPDVRALAKQYDQVEYLGSVSASDAAELVSQHRWALLPIDDEVTKYAFPSKSSGYALSGSGVLAICGAHTSVARWVENLEVGMVCSPDLDSLVKCFLALEIKNEANFSISDEMRRGLLIPHFVACLHDVVMKKKGTR